MEAGNGIGPVVKKIYETTREDSPSLRGHDIHSLWQRERTCLTEFASPRSVARSWNCFLSLFSIGVSGRFLSGHDLFPCNRKLRQH
jgi:hypothetical protein